MQIAINGTIWDARLISFDLFAKKEVLGILFPNCIREEITG
jgi:hypothetical protein